MTVLKAKIGGVFTPVLSGYASGVFVGPNAPTDPNVEFWVDTDDVLPVVPWIPLAFTNGWSQRAGEQVAAYRKIGDMVSIKGSITRGTALVAPIYSPCAILPVGFRPPIPMKLWAMFAAEGNGGPGLLSVEPDGQIKVGATATNASNPHLMTQFEGSFSVTP